MRKQNGSTESAKKQIANEKEVSSVSNAASSTTAPETATALPQTATEDETPAYETCPIKLSREVSQAYSAGADFIKLVYALIQAGLLIAEDSKDPSAFRLRLTVLEDMLRVAQYQAEDSMGHLESMTDDWKAHMEGLERLQKGGV
jgi:hypothetical protein